MSSSNIVITRPTVLASRAVCFSAYGLGWGYRAFELPFEVACETLGAADATSKQALLAFELGKRQILQAVSQRHAEKGGRLMLTARDFSTPVATDAHPG